MTAGMHCPEFILMLTRNDATVANARELVTQISNPALHIVGFKDVGLDKSALTELATMIRQEDRKVALEVVSLDEAAEMRSVELALSLDVDLLLGGTHASEVVNAIRGTKITYLPFPGKIHGHPSKLKGSIAEITHHARQLAALEGVGGLDLLAYRHAGNATELMESVISAVDIPVVVAGSIDCREKISAVASCGAWGFTVGAAAIDNVFSPTKPTINHQIETILRARDEAANRGRVPSEVAE